jgi:hypothetical protein
MQTVKQKVEGQAQTILCTMRDDVPHFACSYVVIWASGEGLESGKAVAMFAGENQN